MSYINYIINYIKESKISNEEWDVLLSQSSKKFLQGVLKSQISDIDISAEINAEKNRII